MLYYLIHQSPIWSKLSDGKRNVRILMICLVIYIMLSYFARTYDGENTVLKMFSSTFLYFVLADVFVNAINYKRFYGRSVIHELRNTDEKKEHIYDEKNHKYVDRKAIKRYREEKELNKDSDSSDSIEPDNPTERKIVERFKNSKRRRKKPNTDTDTNTNNDKKIESKSDKSEIKEIDEKIKEVLENDNDEIDNRTNKDSDNDNNNDVDTEDE